MKILLGTLRFAVLSIALCVVVGANTSSVMVGAPPPAADLVTRANWRMPPNLGWALQHIETILPTTTVDRGAGPVSTLDPEPFDLTRFEFADYTGKRRNLTQFLDDQHIDALVLWSHGKVRQEIYRNGETARTRHLMFSVTKSFTGLVAEMLIAEGRLDDAQLVTRYVPELKGSAYEDATVRNLMNMEIGIDFSEVYDDPSSTIYQFAYASGMRVPPPGIEAPPSLYEFLPSLRKKGPHGQDFHYVTANSEVLGWVVEKVTENGLPHVFEQMLYAKIGAERDAFYVTDPHGKAIAGGGLNITARDALRLAITMAQEGRFNGQQIVPAAVVSKIAAGSTPRPSLPGNEDGGHDHSYMSQWYIDHSNGVVSAMGIHGQTIHFQPREDVAMVVQSSYPDADGPLFDVLDNFFASVVAQLKGKP